jgi:GNAT superfamily N-acetyltransferase
MTSLSFEPVATPNDIARLAALAEEIWYDYYVPLIGREQVAYMVGKFQSVGAIAEQIDQGYEYFLVLAGDSRRLIGYTAVQEQDDGAMFISKVYLLREERGHGTGRRLMAFIEDLAQKRGLERLWLTVNKGNAAVAAYERLGFVIAESIVMDIGSGFVMDDYRMEKDLSA